MKSKALRIACALFAVCLVLLSVPACRTVRPSAENGIQSVTAGKKDQVTVTASVNDRTLKEAPGKKAYLYELLPGESSIADKEPIAEDKLAHNLKFTFPLLDGERSRVTSSFLVAFEDGSLLSPDARWMENPEKLAKNRDEFLWADSPKGLNATDVEQAFETGAFHVMLKESFADLVGEDGALSEAAVTRLDAKIRAASDAGMQVSLTVDINDLFSYTTIAKLFHALAVRYNGGENGCISALFIPMKDRYDNALLCRLAGLALRSQVANSRVYMVSDAESAEIAASSFASLSEQLYKNGPVEWGAAIAPEITQEAWLPADEETLSVSDFSGLFSILTDPNGSIKADYLALCDITFYGLSHDKQAVSFAYTYREAVKAGADLVFFGSQFENATGLYRTDGTPNRAASVFCEIDTGLSPANLLLCETLAGDAWRLGAVDTASRKLVSGASSLGTANGSVSQRISFADGALHGFFSVAASGQPTTQLSAAFGEKVLLTWLDPARPAESGIRKTFSRAKELQKISDLSVRLLTQVPSSDHCKITLSLEGSAKDGTRISYESGIDIANQSWQTVSFDISPFTRDVDPSKPCTLTLSAAPEGEADTPFVLFVRELDLHRKPMNTDVILPLAVAVGGTAAAFLPVMLIYTVTRLIKKRHRAASAPLPSQEDETV